MSSPQPAGISRQLVLGATESLSRARDLLLRPTPQNLDIACTPLTAAIEHVTGLQTVLSASPSRDMAVALEGLRKEIDSIAGLLENAACYHVNLIQCMVEASSAQLQPGACSNSARRLSLDV